VDGRTVKGKGRTTLSPGGGSGRCSQDPNMTTDKGRIFFGKPKNGLCGKEPSQRPGEGFSEERLRGGFGEKSLWRSQPITKGGGYAIKLQVREEADLSHWRGFLSSSFEVSSLRERKREKKRPILPPGETGGGRARREDSRESKKKSCERERKKHSNTDSVVLVAGGFLKQASLRRRALHTTLDQCQETGATGRGVARYRRVSGVRDVEDPQKEKIPSSPTATGSKIHRQRGFQRKLRLF